MTKEWFVMNFKTRVATFVVADDIYDARNQGNAVLGPIDVYGDLGAAPRGRRAFDRFPDMKVGEIFPVPER